ncbi:MAG: hypothetical protein E4H14_08390 [Candidatus Thorarchaeota archaeon]|nr:MAG: hypothetical protein E4H14_08390 [Candidatus Thorarchaeota archaeon]
MKFSMITEAEALARVKGTKRHETLKEVQKAVGLKSLKEAAEFYDQDFSREVSPEDYDEWIRQIVMHSSGLKNKGAVVNLNKRSSFNDVAGDVLENDPAGKVNAGDDELMKHVLDALWKRYQHTRDHLKASNVMKAREEEELMQQQADAGYAMAGIEDEEDQFLDNRHRMQGARAFMRGDDIDDNPYPEGAAQGNEWDAGWKHAREQENDPLNRVGYRRGQENEELNTLEPPSMNTQYKDDMEAEMGRGDVEADDMETDGDMDDEMGQDVPQECPYDEGTPECDAWMAGFEAGQEQSGEGDMEVGDEMDDEMEYEAGDEVGGDDMDREEGSFDEEPMGRREMEDEGMSRPCRRCNCNPCRCKEGNEEKHYTRGYRAAQDEYRTGKRGNARKQHPQWERGFEEFMGDTEGQRELQRKIVKQGAEDEQFSLKSILTKPKETIDTALKGVEDEGAIAFHKMQLPKNPHPAKSLANKAWAKGFKNTLSDTMGFSKVAKPALKKAKRKK